MRKLRSLKYIFLLFLFTTPFWAAQRPYILNSSSQSLFSDSIFPSNKEIGRSVNTPSLSLDTIISPIKDSINLSVDSLQTDSVGKKHKSSLDATVDYLANDSIVFTAGNWGFLYGASEIYYTDLKLTSEKIILNMDSSMVTATYGLDSIGKEFGYPVFNQKGTDYESKWMKYNFKTQKGLTRNSITQQGEGYVVANKAKKNPDNSFFMTDGTYTTCDEHDHPHFYIKMTKAKVVPGKNVVTGPAYLIIEDLPIPFIGLPFGFFPFSDKYSSGVLFPSIGDDMDKGFFIHNGGYYFAINDYIDLALTGEIYTKGSWGVNALSKYKKRYKYSGTFDFGYMNTKLGEKGIDYTEMKDMRLNWTHSQDIKFNKYRTLSASVNFATSKYSRNQLDMLGTSMSTENTRSSSVNLTQRIPNSPWNFSASMNINQRTKDSTVSITLPDLAITMSRIYPFRRKEMVGNERWYEKIYMSYTGNIRNSITTKEDSIFRKSLIKDWNNGMKHNIPIGATFNLFDYLNITPTFNYTERWYSQKIRQRWDAENQRYRPQDTTYSFYRVYDFNMNLSFQTKMYGMYIPLFFNKKIDRIRHVFTPSISFSYQPDFSNPKYGSWERDYIYDANGEIKEHRYSPFGYGIYGTSPSGKSAMINFSFDNNLEMKWRTSEDSLKKISLIDNLGINFSYNMAADSMKWSDINTNLRLKLSKSLTINVNAVFDPYMYDLVHNNRNEVIGLRKVDKLRINNGKGIGRLKSTGYSISPSINQDTFKKWFGGGDKTQNNEKTSTDEDTDENKPRESLFTKKQDDGEYDADGYYKNEVKWDLSFNYSMNYAYNMSRIDVAAKEFKRELTHNFGLSGSIQPTKNWNFRFSASYDFDAQKIAYSSFSLTRNLHCWAISANFVPMGPSKFFYVKLSASSRLLQDLKYEERKRASSRDPEWD